MKAEADTVLCGAVKYVCSLAEKQVCAAGLGGVGLCAHTCVWDLALLFLRGFQLCWAAADLRATSRTGRREGVCVESHSLLFQKGFHYIFLCQTWNQFWTIRACFSFLLSCVSCKWQLTWKLIFPLFSTIIQSCRNYPVGHSSGDGHLTVFMGYSKKSGEFVISILC